MDSTITYDTTNCPCVKCSTLTFQHRAPPPAGVPVTTRRALCRRRGQAPAARRLTQRCYAAVAATVDVTLDVPLDMPLDVTLAALAVRRLETSRTEEP